MADEKKDVRDYMRGYNDAHSGNKYQTPSVVDILTSLLPGFPVAGTNKDYDKGYRDGEQDRKNSK